MLGFEIGILGTVQATIATCPAALRDRVARLLWRLGRSEPRVAVRQFADELDDPSGDLVASVLLLALSRSGRTAELLSELAATIRERAAMRLRIEAERSGQRSEAKFVVTAGILLVAGIAVFGRNTSFLSAYDTPTGQLVLLAVAVLYATGLVWLTRLTKFAKPARFLTIQEINW
jgi:Flp pilus assembly protein TadB